MRQGDSDRGIAEAWNMGRRKAGQWRAPEQTRGWLDAQIPLPECVFRTNVTGDLGILTEIPVHHDLRFSPRFCGV